MATRPTFIDLRSTKPTDANDSRLNVTSPRFQHFDGDIPPTLSPLDAFAAQGRLLAKQLDESRRSNRRVSRLPPSTVTQSLTQHRPVLARSPSGPELSDPTVQDGDDHGFKFEMEQPRSRPKSEYVRMSGLPRLGDMEEEDEWQTPLEHPAAIGLAHDGVANVVPSSEYFGASRPESPQNVLRQIGKLREPSYVEDHAGSQTLALRPSGSRTELAATTIPPVQAMPPGFTKPPHMESSDDDYTSSNAGSTFSQPRRLSSSSGMSMPHSPMSPFIPTHPRSPSLNSEISVGGTRQTRTTFNFSRPLSSSSMRRSIDSAREQSFDSHHTNPSIVENPPTPVISEARHLRAPSEDMLSANSSYTYAKFSLPRGRMVSRDSIVFSGLSTPHFEWAEPLFESPSASPAHSPAARASASSDSYFSKPPAPPLPAPTSNHNPGFSFDFTANEATRLPQPDGQPEIVQPPRPQTPQQTSDQLSIKSKSSSPGHSVKSTSSPGRKSAETGDLRNLRAPILHEPFDRDDAQSTSSKSNSTIKPGSTRTGMTSYSYTSSHLTPEEHVAKGIECHENGSLKESTYHLRIAAMQNHPTGMLLYALACRHGWGMRANQREGVQWLRKAVDSAVLEVADDEDPTSSNRAEDFLERKARRAQFALSIYELGVSHLNGWGIEQDKALALRCFEIAGNWGDADALAEAGYCYAEGIGSKKDLKKAAKFYRLAENNGMNMVGNSW